MAARLKIVPIQLGVEMIDGEEVPETVRKATSSPRAPRKAAVGRKPRDQQATERRTRRLPGRCPPRGGLDRVEVAVAFHPVDVDDHRGEAGRRAKRSRMRGKAPRRIGIVGVEEAYQPRSPRPPDIARGPPPPGRREALRMITIPGSLSQPFHHATLSSSEASSTTMISTVCDALLHHGVDGDAAERD